MRGKKITAREQQQQLILQFPEWSSICIIFIRTGKIEPQSGRSYFFPNFEADLL